MVFKKIIRKKRRQRKAAKLTKGNGKISKKVESKK
jgi:hypothetical protein